MFVRSIQTSGRMMGVHVTAWCAVATPSHGLDELLAEQLCCFRRSTVPTESVVVVVAVVEVKQDGFEQSGNVGPLLFLPDKVLHDLWERSAERVVAWLYRGRSRLAKSSEKHV